MTVLEKIKESGGFLDCGAVGSMPLGYFIDGTIMSTDNYNEARRLVSDRKLKKTGSGTNENFSAFLSQAVMKGEIYKAK